MQRLTRYALRGGLAVVGGFLLVVGLGGSAYANHYPPEMVSMTKHNLSANPNIAFGPAINGSSEVCVFCHTPHGFTTGPGLSTGFPPLWNRRINVTTSYTTYADASSPHFDAANTGGAPLSTAGIKGVSLACLSCHDGTIAFDALINLQGSGGYQANNKNIEGPGGDTTLAAAFGGFTGEAVDAATHTFKAGDRPTQASGNPFGGALFSNDTLVVGTGGAAPFPNLTTNLTDDHPISFMIPCDTPGGGNNTNQATCADPQFAEVVNGSVSDADFGGSGNLLYLKRANGASTNGVVPQDKRDRIRAYPSDPAGGSVQSGHNTNAYIECASCHNPHTPRTLFLRLPSNVDNTGAFVDPTQGGATGLTGGYNTAVAPSSLGVTATYWTHAPNQASAICLSCHQK